jgi:hypothetical protein
MKSIFIISAILLLKEIIDYFYEKKFFITGDSLFWTSIVGIMYLFGPAGGLGLFIAAWCERKSKLSQWRFCEGYLNTSASWERKHYWTDQIVSRRHWARPIVLNLVTPFSDGEHLFQLLFTVYLCLLMPNNFIINYIGSTLITIAFKMGLKRWIV